jgi:hypothetical protein
MLSRAESAQEDSKSTILQDPTTEKMCTKAGAPYWEARESMNGQVTFKAGQNRRRRIFGRMDILIRMTNPKRRPSVTGRQIEMFSRYVRLAKPQFASWKMTSAAETSQKMIKNHLNTVALSGTEGRCDAELRCFECGFGEPTLGTRFFIFPPRKFHTLPDLISEILSCLTLCWSTNCKLKGLCIHLSGRLSNSRKCGWIGLRKDHPADI